jgi:signal transduction histidine kinase/ligand-binding sensor domain-containing protein
MFLLTKKWILLLLVSGVITGQEYSVQYYTTSMGLTENEVRDITQDRDGFLWFATGNGVSRFDGIRFNNYAKDKGIHFPLINKLLSTPDGAIYALGREHLYLKSSHSDTFAAVNGKSIGFFTGIGMLSDSTIILSTDQNGFFDVRDNRYVSTKRFDAVRQNKERNLILTAHTGGQFIVVGDNIYGLDSGEPDFLFQIPKGNLNQIFQKDENLYLATSEGAFVYHMRKKSFESLLPFSTPFNCLDIRIDSFGFLWLATSRGLYFRRHQNETIHLFKSNTNPLLNRTWYWRIYEDRVQNIWFSPAGFGAGKLGNRYFENYSELSGIPANVYWVLQQDKDQQFWFAGPNGIDFFPDPKQLTRVYQKFLAGYDIRDIAIHNKVLYAVANNVGLIRLAPETNQFATIVANDTGEKGKVLSVGIDANNTILVGTTKGLFVLDKGVRKVFPRNGRQSTVWLIKKSPSGIIWLGTNDGLYAFNRSYNDLRHWGKAQGLPYLNVKTIEVIDKYKVWIAYFEAGGASLIDYRRTNQTEAALNADNGLPSNKVFSIVTDNRKRLWVGTANGLFRQDQKEQTVFNTGHGLLWVDFWRNGVLALPEGDIFFSTSLGLSKYIPQLVGAPEVSPKAVITSAVFGEDKPRKLANATIPYGNNFVEIHYATLHFKNEESIQYMYRLIPEDEKWHNAPKEGIQFRSLGPGSYRFELSSHSSHRGFTENIETITFAVANPFYFQPLVVTVFTLTVLLLIWMWYLQKTRSIRNRNLELNSEVTNRTRALADKNQQLQKLLSKLQKTQAQLVHSEKMASLGLLSAGLAHEVNNPISFTLTNALYVKNELEAFRHHFTAAGNMTKADIDDLIDAAMTIVEGSQRVKDVVNNLQSFAKPQEAEYKLVNINDNIKATLKLVENQYRHNIEFVLQLDDTLPPFYCYPSLINQVFLNLILNGVQSIEDKGIVTIQTQYDAAKIAIIRVTDTGKGIPENIRGRIFDPFFTTKPVGQGTGLGLSISHSIVSGKHGGALNFSSEPGKGTTFEMTLPTDRPPKVTA